MNLESLRHHYTRTQEWPFNSDTKTMTVKCSARFGSDTETFFMKGAIDRVLPQCNKYLHRGTELPIDALHRQTFIGQATRMGSSGLRGEHRFNG